MPYNFDLTKINAIDDNRQQDVWRFNLAMNHALLSGDSGVIRRFYQKSASSLGTRDIYKFREVSRSFFRNSPASNAFTYVGIVPWVVESMVRLVASSGFSVQTPLRAETQDATVDQDSDTNQDNAEIDKQSLDEYALFVCEQIKLQDKFEKGVYLESGLGDLLFRISYDNEISDKPIVDIIEPQNFELKYRRGHIYEIVIKDSSDEVDLSETKIKNKRIIEMRETYIKDLSKVNTPSITIQYSFWYNQKEITHNNPIYASCKEYWGITDTKITLPFKDFPLIYKQNSKQSLLYKWERGVPDIHGLDTVEDALSESLSQLIDTIRKATPKLIVDESMLPCDAKGNTLPLNDFDRVFIILKEAGADPTKLLTTIQARIEYQSFIETFKSLVSLAINKAGLSPTTLGVTGLESINSSQESQDSREKPSLRTRKIKHKGWKLCLEELLNKYFQFVAYLANEPITDYGNVLDISFNEYINPSTESVLAVIGGAVTSKVYSIETGVVKVFEQEGRDYSLQDIIVESARIKGITPEQEMIQLGLIPPKQEEVSTLEPNNQDKEIDNGRTEQDDANRKQFDGV